MPLDAFRIFKSPGDKKKEDSVQRRRAQVRRAQRTYQERKNAYAKSLEDALARSRTREAALTTDNDRLRAILDSVADKIPPDIFAEINNPSSISSFEGFASPLTATATAVGSGSHSYSHSYAGTLPGSAYAPSAYAPSASLSPYHFDGVGFSSSSPSHASSVVSHTTTIRAPNPNTGYAQKAVFTLQGTLSTGLASVVLGEFDEVVVGMEFVLFLERPCLGHIHGDADSQHLAHGHALTVSSQILTISDNAGVSPPPDPLSISHTLSKSILANLLQLAPQVNLSSSESQGPGSEHEEREEREVTPVQAWDALRRRAGFQQIQVHRLKNLLDELSRLAKCYGFGASVPAREFERVMNSCIGFL